MSGRVLIVEDSDLGGRTLRTILQAAGYETRLETNAVDGLAAAQQWEPAIVVLDRHLPDGDGAKLATKFKTVPVVILSGDAKPKGVRGVTAWLTKPVSARELIEAIKRAT